MKRIRKIKANGKEFKVSWRVLENGYIIDKKTKQRVEVKTLGLCDLDEKTIYINPKQSKKEIILTLLHECLGHAIHPEWGEKKVLRFEKEVWSLLKKLKIKFD